MIEGERFVMEMAKRGAKFEYLLYENRPSNFSQNCTYLKCSPAVLSALSQTVTPSGVIGVVKMPKREFALPKSNFLILDEIQDPGNLGTIIRTALAFDFRDIYLFNCVDYLNDKVLRSTMGTIADVRLYEFTFDELQLLNKFDVYLADMEGESIDKISPKNNICGVILGNEANGVSDEVAQIANKTVKIPMQNDVESLNVAIAGGIIMNKFNKQGD